MNDLTQEDTQNFKNLLLAEQTRLQTRLSELNAQDPFNDPEHSNDNAAIDKDASEESDHDRVAALIDEVTVQLGKVNQALVKISQGTYGICDLCDQPIGLDRIKVNPVASLCITCESNESLPLN